VNQWAAFMLDLQSSSYCYDKTVCSDIHPVVNHFFSILTLLGEKKGILYVKNTSRDKGVDVSTILGLET